MIMAKTSAERKRDQRQRERAAGVYKAKNSASMRVYRAKLTDKKCKVIRKQDRERMRKTYYRKKEAQKHETAEQKHDTRQKHDTDNNSSFVSPSSCSIGYTHRSSVARAKRRVTGLPSSPCKRAIVVKCLYEIGRAHV